MPSFRSRTDFALTADPDSAAWKHIHGVIADRGRFGEPQPEARTDIRSRWTSNSLYFLFVSDYDSLFLKPDPSTERDTWGLWEYDVVEVFIGYDLKNIDIYKEFEVSPQAEWVDLDVDRKRKKWTLLGIRAFGSGRTSIKHEKSGSAKCKFRGSQSIRAGLLRETRAAEPLPD